LWTQKELSEKMEGRGWGEAQGVAAPPLPPRKKSLNSVKLLHTVGVVLGTTYLRLERILYICKS
jgi:hypothetical protein